MRRTVASLVSLTLALTGGAAMALQADAAPTPRELPTPDAVAARSGVPTDAQRVPGPADEPRRVMVLLKQQPTGKGNKTQGLAAVDRVLARWKEKDGFEVNRKFGMLVRGFSATLPQSQIMHLAADPDVASVKPLKVFYQSMETAGSLTNSVQAREDLGVDGRGLVVSIIDSGIDIKHQDMRLDDGVKGRLAPEKGFTDKVPYGWNFADQNADVYDTGSEHGMHVAGIVAANGGSDADAVANGRIRGIAPNAQLLAMKVFSNDPKLPGAFEDDIIAAIEESVARGADVINMSLGSPNGTNQSQVGEGRAIANAQAAGVQVIVAAGNEGLNGSPDGTLTDELDMLDDGTMGSPSTTKDALAVASVNNTASIVSSATVTSGGQSSELGYQLQTGEADGKPHAIVDGKLGKPEEIPAEAKGNYVLIERGEISFADKFKNAIAKGAVGVVVMNSAEGGDEFAGMGGLDDVTIPGAFVFHSTGQELRDKIAAGETTITLTEDRLSIPMTDALAPSSFTSWGATPELDFKPQLAGIGGSVYSTINDDSYGDKSGTSMAAPHVAGAFALAVQEYTKRFPELSAKERNALVRAAFSNTAKVLTHDDAPYAVRQMGAGLIQTKEALETDVFATVEGEPNVALRELRSAKDFTVKLTNKGKSERTFSVGGSCSVAESQAPEGNETSCTTLDKLTAKAKTVTVPAGGTTDVSFTVTPGAGAHWVQGWATFTSDDKAQPSLSVPYLGFAGDWNAEPIIDAPRKGGEPLLDKVLGDKHETVTSLMGNFPVLGAVPNTWFSPNGDDTYDEVFPSLAMLRSASDIEYEVLKDGKVIQALGADRDVQRLSLGAIAGSGGAGSHIPTVQKWDGRLFDPATDSFVDAPNGDGYVFRVKARLGADFPWQTTDLPFGLDRVAPSIDSLTHVKNDDGSLTYTLKASDDHSGVFWRSLVVSEGATQKPYDYTTDEAAGTATFTVPADKTGDGQFLDIKLWDRAGNTVRIADTLGRDSVRLMRDWYYDQWIDASRFDLAAGRPVVLDGHVHLMIAAGPSVTKVTVNGQEAELKQGVARIDVPVEEGLNEFVIVGLAADGSEIGTQKHWLGVDNTPPTLEITQAPLNNLGELVPDADGKVTIEGRFKDNFPKAESNSWIMFDQNSNLVQLADDGSFTYETTVTDDQLAVTLLLIDHFDGEHMTNPTTKSWPIAGRSTPGSQLAITFDDPLLNSPHEEERFGQTAYVVDPSLQNLTYDDAAGTAELRLKGTFNALPGKFIVDGKEVQLDKDRRFDIPLTLKGGTNHVGYEIIDADGNRAAMGSWRFFFDRTLPSYEMTTDPGIDADGAMYLQKKSAEVSVKGAVWDDQFGYELAINGSTVKDFDNLWDPGAPQNRREFATKVGVKDGDTMRVSLFDQMGNGVERGIPVVYDDAAPTVDISGVKAGQIIDGKQRIKVRATDENLKTLTVLVDGKEHEGKVVDQIMHPNAYVVPFLNGESQANRARSAADGQETELVVEVQGLSAGRHVLEAVAADKADRRSVASVAFIVDNAAPVIDGPDALSVDPDKDIMQQIRAAYSVTDDVDEGLQVQADLSKLILDQAVTLTLTAADAAGHVTTREVQITLERPMTTLKGECGSMTARFVKSDSISITCTKQSDGSTVVKIRNAGQPIDGTVTVNVTGDPVYLLDAKGNIVSRIASKPGKGTLTFQSSSKANYRIGELPARGEQPIEDHKPGEPVDKPGLPKTGH